MDQIPEKTYEARDKLFQRLIRDPAIRASQGHALSRLARSVRSVEIGPQTRDGVQTGDWAVRVRVTRKYRQIPKEKRIPKTVLGIPTDVITAGRMSLSASSVVSVDPQSCIRVHQRPGLVGGVAIGSMEVLDKHSLWGTAGAVACSRKTRKHRFLLSNRHVLAMFKDDPPENDVIQPGDLAGEVVGSVQDQFELGFPVTSQGAPNVADAALVALLPNVKSTLQVNTIGKLAGAIIEESELIDLIANPGVVTKIGAKSGQTRGVIDGFRVGVRVPFGPRKTAVFDGQIAILPERRDVDKPARFTDKGDSGALVITEKTDGYYAVGLAFAGTKHVTYASPLKPIVDRFDIAFT